MQRTSVVAMLVLAMCSISAGQGQTQSKPSDSSLPKQYDLAEYTAYQKISSEKDAAIQIKLLDEFVSNHPRSALLIYVYPLYYSAYGQLKNYAKVIIYAEKLVALGDNADVSARYAARYASARAYNSMNSSDPKLAAKARSSALAGIKLLSDLKKPDRIDEKAFDADKTRAAIYFHSTAGIAAIALKNYSAAVESFKAVMQLDTVPGIVSR